MLNVNLTPVVLYSKPSCVQCVASERKLKASNIRYRKIDVTEDSAGYDLITELGYKQVPVVIIPFGYGELSGQHFSGFDPDRIEAINASLIGAH